MSSIQSMLSQDSSSTAAEVDLASPNVQDTTLPKAVTVNKDESVEIYNRDYALKYALSRMLYYYDLMSQKRLSTLQSCQAKFILQAYERQLSGSSHNKPVPYNGIDKDEGHAAEVEINRLVKEAKDWSASFRPPFFEDDYHNLIKLVGGNSGECSIRVGPVLQLISVRISNKSDGSLCNDFETYGEISVPDDKNSIFYLYKRVPDNPDSVTPDRNYLNVDGCPIAPVMGGKVKFSLTSKDSGRQIFDGEYDVGESSIDDDEEKYSTLIKCAYQDGYYALMEFNKIQYAFIAKVDMFLCYDPPPTGEPTCRVHGTIKVNNKVLCFNTDDSNPVEMYQGKKNYFVQSRSVFAVPVMSPRLDIQIELFSAGGLKIADETLELNGSGLSAGLRSFYYPCKDKSYCFGMDLLWLRHEDYFESGCWMEELNAKWSCEALYIRQLRLPSKKSKKSKKSECVFVEVFSVFVGGGDPRPALCGTIVVKDRKETVYIFSRDRNRPDKLSSSSTNKQLRSRTLSLVWPDMWVVEKDFYMHLKLKDVHGNEVCRGYLQLVPYVDARYDRRLCSVITGENGYYAAVHYSVFRNGKKAKVTVKWEGDYAIVVYGSVVAEYSTNYDYLSTYDKEYYRSIIFKRYEEEGVRVESCSEIPLSKSHVSAPSNCEGLRVHVKLWHRPILGTFTQQRAIDEVFDVAASVHTTIPLECFSSCPTPNLVGCILVKVEWE